MCKLTTVEAPRELSAREREILSLASQGLTYKAIAVELDVALETIKSYFTVIRDKLVAADKAQAVAIALREGQID